MAQTPDKHCVIIGAAKSGKTSLVGVLQFATAQLAEHNGLALRIFPRSPDMGELIRRSNAAVRNGKMPGVGTLGVKRYVFDYEITHNLDRRVFQTTSHTRFSMIDTPGGALLGERDSWAETGLDTVEMEKARAEAVAELRTASSIILCADSTNESAAADFVEFLPDVLRETGLNRLPCRQFVICLTKADKYVVDHPDIHTRDEFSYEDPVKRAEHIISNHSLSTLKMYLRDAKIKVGWASTYGFAPHHGYPNYDPKRDGLLIDVTQASISDVLKMWQPYQVIDPFVFLTVGEPMSLRPMNLMGDKVPGMKQPEWVSRVKSLFGRRN